jgi:hypothetical protein
MRIFATVILFCFCSSVFAYELLMVQAVSATKKSFVTRNGKRQGVVENLTGTFTANDVAVIARARTVTSLYTQWEVLNDIATVPFEPGTVITYHPAQEHLWSLNPEEARRRYIWELRPEVKTSMLVKGAITKGLNESTSQAAVQSVNRGGVALDFLYEKLFNYNLAWDAGIRYENEVVNLAGGSLITQRLMVIADFLYYFDPLDVFYGARVFLSAGFGYGQSSTSADGNVQSGYAMLLPSAKIGMTLPFNREWDFIMESAFETLQTQEELEDRSKQTTNQSNLRIALGLRKFF